MQIGDYVVHRSGKVCRVDSIEEMNLTGKPQTYLILSPVRSAMEKIYVPESVAEEQLRPAMSRMEALHLIGRLEDIRPLTIQNERQREQEYREAFNVRSYESIVSIAKELYNRKQRRVAIGKTLPSRDAQMMTMVEKTLEEALSVALGVSAEKVRGILTDPDAQLALQGKND